MKIFVYILSTLVSIAIVSGFAAAAALTTRDSDNGFIFVGSLALALVVMGGVYLQSVTFFWDPNASTEGRRIVRRFHAVYAGIEIVGVVAVIIWAMLAHAPLWLPAAVATYVILVTALILVVAPPLRRRDIARERLAPPRPPVDATLVGRTQRNAAISSAVVLVLAAIAVVIVESTTGDRPDDRDITQLSFYAVGFAVYAGIFGCFRLTFRLNRSLLDITSRDPGLQRRLTRLILQRKPVELADNERAIAARYAGVLAVSLPFSLETSTLLFVGLALQQLGTLIHPTSFGPVLAIVLLCLLAVMYGGLLPLNLKRIRLARAYAAEHADLLLERIPSDIPVSDGTR